MTSAVRIVRGVLWEVAFQVGEWCGEWCGECCCAVHLSASRSATHVLTTRSDWLLKLTAESWSRESPQPKGPVSPKGYGPSGAAACAWLTWKGTETSQCDASPGQPALKFLMDLMVGSVATMSQFTFCPLPVLLPSLSYRCSTDHFH